MEPNERLSAWIAAAKISHAEMARRVECDKANFHRILRGRAKPTLELSSRIEAQTGGTIPIGAWVGFMPHRPEPASPSTEAKAA